MKKNIFTDGDSWLISGLSTLFDSIFLSILTMILCIPVITIGAAITANMDAMLHISMKKDAKIFKRFFVSFGKNFLKSTLIWLIFLVVGGLIGGAAFLSVGGYLGDDTFITVIKVFSLLMLLLYGITFSYVFTLQARYENPIGTTIINAILIGISNFPRSIIMVGLTAGMVALGYFFFTLLPLFVFLEFSLVTFISSKLIVPVLAKMGDREAAGEDVVYDEEEPVSEEAGEKSEEEKNNKGKKGKNKGKNSNKNQ